MIDCIRFAIVTQILLSYKLGVSFLRVVYTITRNRRINAGSILTRLYFCEMKSVNLAKQKEAKYVNMHDRTIPSKNEIYPETMNQSKWTTQQSNGQSNREKD